VKCGQRLYLLWSLRDYLLLEFTARPTALSSLRDHLPAWTHGTTIRLLDSQGLNRLPWFAGRPPIDVHLLWSLRHHL
jgi:hypothetical protein